MSRDCSHADSAERPARWLLARRRSRLPAREAVQPRLQRGALGGEVEAEIAGRIGREPLERAPHHALRAHGVAVAQVVERDRDLDEALEEVARRAAQPRPHVLERVVALEVETAVELVHALGEEPPLLVVELWLGE